MNADFNYMKEALAADLAELLAKDFNMTSKVISEILTEYTSAPKNYMQVLENNELDLIFEYLTQHNQVGSIAEVFAVPAPKAPERKPENKPHHTGKQPAQQQGQGRTALPTPFLLRHTVTSRQIKVFPFHILALHNNYEL